MLNLDPTKLLIIAVVAVILLGPDKLPQVGRQAGAGWRTFNDFRHRMESEVRSSIPDLPSSADIARMARSPSALLNHLSNLSPDGTERPTGPPWRTGLTGVGRRGEGPTQPPGPRRDRWRPRRAGSRVNGTAPAGYDAHGRERESDRPHGDESLEDQQFRRNCQWHLPSESQPMPTRPPRQHSPPRLPRTSVPLSTTSPRRPTAPPH